MFSPETYGAVVEYIDRKVIEASGVVPCTRLPGTGQTENTLYNLSQEYQDGDVLRKKGLYMWENPGGWRYYGSQFTDWTPALKSNIWNKSHGVFDTEEYQCSLIEIQGNYFMHFKYKFNSPIIDISAPNKVIELPFELGKKVSKFIGIKQHGGYKTWEAARKYYYDPTGEGYIDPATYENMTIDIKDMVVDSDGYCQQKLDPKGDLLYMHNWLSNFAPILIYNPKTINAKTPTEVNKIKRPYDMRSQWVEITYTTDPAHRYDKEEIEADVGEDYAQMYMEEDEYGELYLYYGDEKYAFLSGTDANKTYNATGDFFYATDTKKLYRYVQNMYKTEKAQFKINSEYMYNIDLYNSGCQVNSEGKVCTLSSRQIWDEDYCITPDIFDGEFEWKETNQPAVNSGGYAEIEGKNVYFSGAIDDVTFT